MDVGTDFWCNGILADDIVIGCDSMLAETCTTSDGDRLEPAVPKERVARVPSSLTRTVDVNVDSCSF